MQLYQHEEDTIIHADAIRALDECIDDGSVDLVFADPPYNIGKVFNGTRDRWPDEESYLQWCYSWLDRCIAKLKPNGSMYVMAATQSMPFLDIYIRQRMTVLSRIVWCYDSSGVQAKTRFGSLYEPILHCAKNKTDYTFNAEEIMVEAKTGAKRKLVDHRKPVPTLYNSKKLPGNVWEFPRVRYRMPEYENHPTQKPVALLDRIVRASSNPGDLVLDPFSGTFTTSYVAQQLSRRSIGIEVDAEYVAIGVRRLGVLGPMLVVRSERGKGREGEREI